jgi:two-component system, NtrC family, response regulator HydG
MRILIVDDEEKQRALLSAHLESVEHEITEAPNGAAAIALLENAGFDMVLTDMKMHPGTGLEVLAAVKRLWPETEVIVMTAYAEARDAVDAMRGGAYDYMIKPFETEELLHHVKHIAERRQLISENQRLREMVDDKTRFDNIIGSSKIMREALRLLARVAPSESSILLLGESGTGKELFADAAHFNSPRKDGPLVRINCAAIPHSLLESELFGHERGAFTGAQKRRIGRFETANKGTLFLDEIGDLLPELQTKLLRFLQEGTINRVGGSQEIRLNVRVIAATHRNLEEMMADGSFREDLYYRLSAFPIFIPPLRERGEDIGELAQHLLKKIGDGGKRLTASSLDILQSHHWPGNVRELENVLERASLLCESNVIEPTDLPETVRRAAPSPSLSPSGEFQLPEEGISIDELERSVITAALKKAEGNKTHAAKLLGITRRRLYSRMESLKINPE